MKNLGTGGAGECAVWQNQHLEQILCRTVNGISSVVWSYRKSVSSSNYYFFFRTHHSMNCNQIRDESRGHQVNTMRWNIFHSLLVQISIVLLFFVGWGRESMLQNVPGTCHSEKVQVRRTARSKSIGAPGAEPNRNKSCLFFSRVCFVCRATWHDVFGCVLNGENWTQIYSTYIARRESRTKPGRKRCGVKNQEKN